MAALPPRRSGPPLPLLLLLLVLAASPPAARCAQSQPDRLLAVGRGPWGLRLGPQPQLRGGGQWPVAEEWEEVPVVLELGPVLRPSFALRDFDLAPLPAWGSPFDSDSDDADFAALTRLFRPEFPGLVAEFAGRLAPAVEAGGFHVEQASGHFKVHAMLPGYEMRPSARQGNGPLSVQVVGRSLVVKGQRQDGSMVSTFQRSFLLPPTVDADRISVTYNNTNGELAVDIPPKAGKEKATPSGEATASSWTEEAGSHTTITLAGGQLAESLQSRLKQQLAAPARTPKRLSQQTPLEKEAAPTEKQKRAVPSPAKSAVLLQAKGLGSFWRLHDAGADGGTSSLEVVAPRGLEVGRPVGQQVPVYNASVPGGESRKPVGHVDLPVALTEKDCDWAEAEVSHQKVLQCKIQGDVVKKVPIRVAEEL